jgi:hypothetical protein
MSTVTVIPPPGLDDKRLALVLAEDRVGHYPEFRAFFVRTFDLDRVGLATPGYLRAASGSTMPSCSSAAAASPSRQPSKSPRSSMHSNRSMNGLSTVTFGRSCAG